MTPAAAPHLPLSLDAWAALPEDEPGEFVDGHLQEEELPDNEHELVVTYLILVLGGWLRLRGGFILGSEAKFAVRPERGRKPDVSVFLPGGSRPRRRGINRVPPDIAIEVISHTPRDVRRDRIEKADEYAAFGVRWYWLIDPASRTLEIWELDAAGRYSRVIGATTGQLTAVPGCPELTLDLEALWAEIDRLDDEV